MARGIVYILTNPCLDGWVKIGMTERDDINQRLTQLNRPENLPLSFRCYAVYHVDDPRAVEQLIHSLIDRIDGSLWARETLDSGRIREREFFRISPETAFGIFYDIAKLRGDVNALVPYEPTSKEAREEEIAENHSKRTKNSFALLNIPVRTELAFLYDPNIVVRTADDKNGVEYEGEVRSVSNLAVKLLTEKCGWHSYHVNGWQFFTKDGVPLGDLRRCAEEEL